MYKVESFFKQYFSLVLLFGALLGLSVPSIGNKLTSLVIPSLFVLMLFTILKVDFSKIKSSLKNPLPILIAIFLSYIIIPAVLYYLSSIFNFTNEQKLSVLFSALAPTVLSAPYFVSIIKGDVEFAFVVSILLTMMAPFVIPLELYFVFNTSIDISFVEIFESILILVFLPIVIIFILKKVAPNIISKSIHIENTSTSLMFFIFTWALVSLNAHLILDLNTFMYFIIILAIVQEFGFFFLIKNISKRFFSKKLSKSLAFSVAVKNTALTAGIAIGFSNDLALLSSIVVIIHVPMFAYILWKRENI